MKKLIALVLLLSAPTFAVAPFTWFWNIKLTGDTATVVKWKNNNDSVRLWSNRLTDTLNKSTPRWVAYSNHDSTFKWMNIDTIPSADTIRSTAFSGVRATFSGNVLADSIHTTKGISAASFNGDVIGNITGNLTGNVTGNVTGNATTATTATNQSGGTVNATTGTFSGEVIIQAPTSNSTLRMNTTDGSFAQFRSNANYNIVPLAYTLMDGGVRIGGSGAVATNNLVVTGIASADSIHSTKGISATTFTGNVVGNVNGSSGSCIGNAATATTCSGNAGTVTNGVYTTGSYSDPAWITALNASKVSGTFTGSVTGDVTGNVSGSSGSCTGNAATATTATNSLACSGNSATATTATNQSGGTVSATTGGFSSTVSVDSLHSTKGISATTGAFSGTISASNFGVNVVQVPCTLYVYGDVDTIKQIDTLTYFIVGKQVTLHFNWFAFTNSAHLIVRIKGIPSAIFPHMDSFGQGTGYYVILGNGSAVVPASWWFRNGIILIADKIGGGGLTMTDVTATPLEFTYLLY